MSTSATSPAPYVGALLRHFGDLRDGTHGDGAVSRQEKEQLFGATVALLDPFARSVLEEFNVHLLNGSGEVRVSGVQRSSEGLAARWALSWERQRAAGISPITLLAHYGQGFHHPHLRGATVAEWPLNVFTEEQAAAEVPTLRAIATADLHNLVFQRDFRIVPSVTDPETQARPESAAAGQEA